MCKFNVDAASYCELWLCLLSLIKSTSLSQGYYCLCTLKIFKHYINFISIYFSSQDGLVVVDTPNVGRSEDIKRAVLEQVFDCAALVYVLECTSSGDIQADKVDKQNCLL